MGLELYKLPLGLTTGIEIALPQTDVVFTITLPGSTNEEFSSRLMARINSEQTIVAEEPEVEGDEPPLIKLDPTVFSKVRKKLFFDTCILGVKGLPEGFEGHQAFFKEYPLAARYLMERADDLAAKADKQVNAALEKLSPTPNGKSFGPVGKSNTKSSSATASQ